MKNQKVWVIYTEMCDAVLIYNCILRPFGNRGNVGAIKEDNGKTIHLTDMKTTRMAQYR